MQSSTQVSVGAPGEHSAMTTASVPVPVPARAPLPPAQSVHDGAAPVPVQRPAAGVAAPSATSDDSMSHAQATGAGQGHRDNARAGGRQRQRRGQAIIGGLSFTFGDADTGTDAHDNTSDASDDGGFGEDYSDNQFNIMCMDFDGVAPNTGTALQPTCIPSSSPPDRPHRARLQT